MASPRPQSLSVNDHYEVAVSSSITAAYLMPKALVVFQFCVPPALPIYDEYSVWSFVFSPSTEEDMRPPAPPPPSGSAPLITSFTTNGCRRCFCQSSYLQCHLSATCRTSNPLARARASLQARSTAPQSSSFACAAPARLDLGGFEQPRPYVDQLIPASSV